MTAKIPRDRKGLLIGAPFKHGKQAKITEKEGKMIPKGFVSGTDFHRLTEAEARAFVIFELKELVRHRDDIKRIQADIRNVCKVHGIGGIALNALYTEVYGANQTSGM